MSFNDYTFGLCIPPREILYIRYFRYAMLGSGTKKHFARNNCKKTVRKVRLIFSSKTNVLDCLEQNPAENEQKPVKIFDTQPLHTVHSALMDKDGSVLLDAPRGDMVLS